MPQLLPILLYAGCFILSLPFHAPRRVAMASPPISFSFDFTNKTSYNSQDLLVQGDARVGGSMVDLTCNTVDTSKMLNCMGRVSYGRPVPFYDTATGEAASFNTHFTFKITLVPRRSKGDGMAFFLASYPPPSVLPPDSYGGAFGLMPGRSWQASGENRFVAVEFDTYNNTDYEPRQTMDHIGIDLNSVKDSVNTTNLPEFGLNGTMTASINFNGSTRMLVARLYFVDRPSMKPVEVSAQLPQLDTLLTPEVTVGFSAATGAGMELHQILSWSFNSTLAPKEQPKSIGLIAAAIAGGACAFLLVIWFILSWFMSKRGHNSLMFSGAGPKQFQYNDLAKATNNFSSDRKLGEGGFGAVYHGTCFKVDNDGDEHDVAVKEILKGSKEGTKAFLAELNTISRTKHKNLVKLEDCRGPNCFSFLDLAGALSDLVRLPKLKTSPPGFPPPCLLRYESFSSWEGDEAAARRSALILSSFPDQVRRCSSRPPASSDRVRLHSPPPSAPGFRTLFSWDGDQARRSTFFPDTATQATDRDANIARQPSLLLDLRVSSPR
ncbi:hypothetical protein ZWY2020_000618 [Hordeum vulgare]|nr:hypothetical protein ZWY2020_000618 [Hordeum vulgare]